MLATAPPVAARAPRRSPRPTDLRRTPARGLRRAGGRACSSVLHLPRLSEVVAQRRCAGAGAGGGLLVVGDHQRREVDADGLYRDDAVAAGTADLVARQEHHATEIKLQVVQGIAAGL